MQFFIVSMAFLALASGQQYVYYTNNGAGYAIAAGAQQQLLVQPQVPIPETPEVTAAITKTTCALKSLLETSCDLTKSVNCEFNSLSPLLLTCANCYELDFNYKFINIQTQNVYF